MLNISINHKHACIHIDIRYIDRQNSSLSIYRSTSYIREMKNKRNVISNTKYGWPHIYLYTSIYICVSVDVCMCVCVFDLVYELEPLNSCIFWDKISRWECEGHFAQECLHWLTADIGGGFEPGAFSSAMSETLTAISPPFGCGVLRWRIVSKTILENPRQVWRWRGSSVNKWIEMNSICSQSNNSECVAHLATAAAAAASDIRHYAPCLSFVSPLCCCCCCCFFTAGPIFIYLIRSIRPDCAITASDIQSSTRPCRCPETRKFTITQLYTTITWCNWPFFTEVSSFGETLVALITLMTGPLLVCTRAGTGRRLN